MEFFTLMTIYLNASSHGLPSQQAMQRIRDHMELELEIGPIAARERVENELTVIKQRAGTLIGCKPEELGFASTTFSIWTSIVTRLDIAGKRLLVAPHEWGENISALKILAANTGAKLEVLPPLALKNPDLSEWAVRIDDDVAGIFAPMVTSIAGHRYPVEAIGALPRPKGCKFVVDAAQALGQTPIDISNLACDVLVATCRKWLRGPRGTALFWLAPSLGNRVTLEDVEPFDANVALRLGLGATLSETLEVGVKKIAEQITQLSAYAYVQAKSCGLDTLSTESPDTGALCLGIATDKVSPIANALSRADQHVKWPDAMNDEPCATEQFGDLTALRISPHIYNSISDIDALFESIGNGLSSKS